MSAKSEALDISKSVLKKSGSKKGAAPSGPESMIGDDFKETLDLLKKNLEQDAKLAAGEVIKGKTKPYFRSPEEAAAYWDKVYKDLAENVKKDFFPIGPQADKITYVKDGKMFSLARDVKPPAGAERVSLTDADILKMMPPRPRIPAGEAKTPNAYNNPPPPDYIRPPTSAPSAAPRASVAASEYAAPGAAAPPPAAANPTIDLARQTVSGPRGTVPSIDTRLTRTPPPKGPWGTKDIPTREPSNLAVYGAPAAIGAGAIGSGIYAGYNPEKAAQAGRNVFNVVTGGTDVVPNERTESPNHDILQGPGVSYGAEDFGSDNVPNDPNFNPNSWRPPYMSPREESPNLDNIPNDGFAIMPEQSGRELGAGDPRFTGPGVSYHRSDFAPNSAVSTARQVINRANNSPAAQAQRAAAVLQESPNQLTVQRGADQGPNALTRFIRGDFSEGADQRIMEAMRRQKEESGVSDNMARGGAASKKSSKDDVLHKALEIIHHMLTRR